MLRKYLKIVDFFEKLDYNLKYKCMDCRRAALEAPCPGVLRLRAGVDLMSF
jgi:hypothetical protein